MLQAPGEQKEV